MATIEEHPQELTEEEITQRKAEMLKFWSKQREFLEAQAGHERLVTEIDELRLRSLIARVRLSEMISHQQESSQEQPIPPVKDNGPMRVLKKEPKPQPAQ